MSHSVSEVIQENQVLDLSANNGHSNGKSTNGSNGLSEVHLELHEHHHEFLALPNKRVRTISESERIAAGPAYRGEIISFCRNKGHGFIKPIGEENDEPVFVHICDIEGEYCPKEGDVVSYKKALMPPKCQKYQAVHVKLVHLKEGIKHEHWFDRPL